MSEEEIDRLAQLIKEGNELGWMDSSNLIHRVRAITEHPAEPSRIAWLKDKSLSYVALYNCPASDFYLIIPA